MRVDEVELADGTRARREFVEHPGAVAAAMVRRGEVQNAAAFCGLLAVGERARAGG